ncbi:hypothetical protein B566_EDAN011938 [Ephemera danica]|nr:hypothetical protein B566_EDAN011938 [Ephemera danica]
MLGTDQNSKLVDGGIVAEAKIALTNLGNVLSAAGTSFGNVVKTTVLVSDLNDFATVNDIYKQFFKEPYPARVSYQVAKLPLGAKIEVDAIAIVGDLVTVES